jgi:ferredoxin
LAEVDENDPQAGVQVVKITSDGAAAKANQDGETDLCLGDLFISIDGQDCRYWTFEQIMETLANADSPVSLKFLRPKHLVAVCFAQNGVGVAAEPGTPLCNVAWEAGAKIPFKCRSGSCGTCEQAMSVDGNEDEPKYVRPCVYRLPRGPERLTIGSSNRYANVAP